MPKYAVKSPVKIRGKIHKDGTVDCSAIEAEPALESGALEPLGPDDDFADLEGFALAIGKLSPDVKKHWMSDGRPQLQALASPGGVKLTAAQRDELWAKYREQTRDAVEGYWIRAKEGTVEVEGITTDTLVFDTDGVGFVLDFFGDDQVEALEADERLVVERGTFEGIEAGAV